MAHLRASLRAVSGADVRASVWFPPAVALVVALVAAPLLVRVPRPPGLGWLGGVDAATSLLQVVATATITVTSLTFSLVVIAIQLASQQFSPRLLREFARDRVIQGVLAILVGTFTFATGVLLSIDQDEPLPAVAVTVAYGLGFASVVALVVFLAHIIRALRVDTMMLQVHKGTAAAIVRSYAPHDSPPERPGDDVPEAARSAASTTRSIWTTRQKPLRRANSSVPPAASGTSSPGRSGGESWGA